ncbi:MAG: hypothetical protein K0R31_1047 [Clostridiales bacterium]|jgi:hypothetical protein|nr:hypothetical protein [Clostridiales bacterium]
MNILRSLKKVHIAVILVVIISSFFVISRIQAVTAEPGTSGDPLVSQSYVDTKINELTAIINGIKQQPGGQSPKFEVLEAIEPGKQIICGASTEVVLRGGTATAIASAQGGISNLSSGKDLKSGDTIPLNQLLLIPREDGRGIAITGKAWVMVKGQYTIK